MRPSTIYEDDQVEVRWDDCYTVSAKGDRRATLYTDEFELAMKFAFLLTDNPTGMMRLQALTEKTKHAKR